mmetsp:Transcript_4966/g.7521  ORF Transcript_4966/g.7521 Transcript_4966/m.7521 type:complete len:343 (-) Transcript_4966:141-1169(-)
MGDNWCTIESDPGVFTELIETIGVKGVQVEELYTLEEDEFSKFKHIHGLIFLFKWRKETDDRPTIGFEEEPELFFAHQVINNACATQAILSILLNSQEGGDAGMNLGDTLQEFKSFTSDFTPDLKGMAISNSDIIRNTHNSFSRNDPFVMEHAKATDKDDVFHFIAYLPFKGKVYELDGLKKGPINLGEVGADGGKDAWLGVARPAIQERINRYAASEIHFNLLSLVKSPMLVAEEGLRASEEQLKEMQAASTALPDGDESKKELEANLQETQAAISRYQTTIEDEQARRTRWKEENIRRRHNYIPLVVQMLKYLAEKGKLKGIVEEAAKKRDTPHASAKVL